MNCYGQYHDCPPEKCEFAASCRYYCQTRASVERQLGGQDFDRLAEWAPDLATTDALPDESVADTAAPENTLPHTAEDFSEFLHFLLHLDDYTLGILAEIIAPQEFNRKRKLSVAELARMRGISRQGMHRKTLRIAQRYPELAGLLGLTVRKIRNSRRELSHKSPAGTAADAPRRLTKRPSGKSPHLQQNSIVREESQS